LPQNFKQKGSLHQVKTNHSSYQKTRINDLSCDIRTLAQVSFVLSQSTCLTDGQKGLCNTVHYITCSRTVKTPVCIKCLNVVFNLNNNYLPMPFFPKAVLNTYTLFCTDTDTGLQGQNLSLSSWRHWLCRCSST